MVGSGLKGCAVIGIMSEGEFGNEDMRMFISSPRERIAYIIALLVILNMHDSTWCAFAVLYPV
jgi:hypothetical protein